MFTSFFRILKFAGQNFWRNIWLSVVTVTMLVLTLLSINVLVVLQFMGKTAIAVVESRIDVTASLVSGTSQNVIGEITNFLSAMPQVVKVDVISPEDALAVFKTKHQNNPSILKSIDEIGSNPFGPTLIIRARSADDYPFILESLENPTYGAYVQNKNFSDHQMVISRINQITDRLRNFGIILAAIFAAIAALIIMNTIRVAIYTYREEIGIMKLVGASNWFVRAPFLAEGMFYGILSVAVTVAVLFPALALIEPYIKTFFDGATVGLVPFFWNNFLTIFGLEFLALIVLNMISASVAVGRYLKA